MRFLTPAQCRAARALLNWSQPDLAAQCSMHVQTISAFEHETGTPTRRTLEKITSSFLEQGIEFTQYGVEKKDSPIFKIEGRTHEEAYLKLLQHAFKALKKQANPELLIMYADDKVSPPSVNELYKEMRSQGIKMRQLISDKNDYIIGPLKEYRCIPSKQFINRVTLIYGDYVANETASVLKSIIRLDPINADIQRNTFEILWSTLRKPTRTTAKEKF